MLIRLVWRLMALLAFSGWLSAAAAQEQMATWRVELDAPKSVRPLLEKHLDLYRFRGRPEVDDALLEALVSRAASDARQLLATEGYFSPEIKITREDDQGVTLVRLQVMTGQLSVVAAAKIGIGGDILEDPGESARRTGLIKRWRLPTGSPFRQSDWDGAKQALLRELVFDGYPAAHIADSTAIVEPETGRVDITITVNSGPLFRFGALDVNGLQRYPRKLVENLRPFRVGDRYSYDAVLSYQAALQASGHFQNASVTVEPDAMHADAAPVVVRVTEHPRMKIDLGVGYSTDSGFRSEAAFAHNSTLQPGWQGLTRLRLDEKQQSFEAGLALLPEAGGWRNRFGTEAVRSDVENLTTRTLSLSARRTWRSSAQEHDWALKFQTEEQSLSGGPVDNLQALSLNYSWTLRRVDDLLHPKRGHLLNLQLGGASESLLSTRTFIRGYSRGLYIVPFGTVDRLHLRGEFGMIQAAARDGIPNEFLFRTGGDQSVRGYAYQSLGVTQGAAIVGGRYLGVATVEYQHDFTAQWGGALFVDAGNAADKLSQLRPVVGYGAGVRWITPAGSINVDVARAQETGKVRLHFTLGARF